MYVVGYDAADRPFYTLFNVANLTAVVNANDDLGLKFRVKDTYLYLTNTNKIYIDRLNVSYDSDKWSLKVGRGVFQHGNGMLIGNVSDGLYARAGLFTMNFKLFAMYSGFLPDDVNQFNVNTMDEISGTERLLAGLVVEKYGFLIDSLSMQLIYSADLSTNVMKYNPFYIGLSGEFVSGALLTLGLDVVYALGSYGTNQSISAYGADLNGLLLIPGMKSLGIEAQLSLASGDSAGGAYNRLQTFGVFDTGFVEYPDFSNMFMAKVGLLGTFAHNHLVVNLDYYYFTRLTTDDDLDEFYSGTGTTIGHEISGSMVYQFDPNWAMYLYGGYFVKGNAFADQVNAHKVIAGLKLTL